MACGFGFMIKVFVFRGDVGPRDRLVRESAWPGGGKRRDCWFGAETLNSATAAPKYLPPKYLPRQVGADTD